MTPLSALRRFARSRPPEQQCELCGLGLTAEHLHLIEPATRRLLCCCDACAILFSGQANARYRRVPRRVQYLSGFRMTDDQWENLRIPINLAFFFHSSPARKVVALYPSPAGTTESFLTPEAWQELAAANPVLHEMEPDVEALLVNRVRAARDYYRAPLDACFQLVGLIRVHWRGFSGGTEVWEEIGRFFAGLKERAS
jgi:hypothetical protein